MKGLTSLAVMSVFLLMIAGNAFAVPRLQTYIVGSSYERSYALEHDSWISHNTNFDLKVVGYWNSASGSGGSLMGGHTRAGRLYDFMDTYLMVSTPLGQSGTVWINGVEMTGFGGYWSNLPGDLDANPSLRFHMPAAIGQFGFASIGRIDNDQINAYDYGSGAMCNPGWGDEILLNVVVSGYSWAHFDAVGVDSHDQTYMNPYSHDASYYRDSRATPEPGTLSLLGLGLLGMVPILKRKRA
jgi:hypothetical protein